MGHLFSPTKKYNYMQNPILTLNSQLPGIAQLFEYAPKLAVYLRGVAQELLRGESPLSPGTREFIAAAVSYSNGTRFCFLTHGYAAEKLLDREIVGLLEDKFLNHLGCDHGGEGTPAYRQ